MININNLREHLEKARDGDEKAFEEVYRTLYDPVFRYCLIRTKNKADSEDIAQTVFLKVFQSIDRFSVTDKHPLSYFFTVARNTIIDRARRKKNEPVANDDLLLMYEDSEEMDIEDKERKRYVEKILSKLPEEDRELLVLSEIEGYSGKEISKILNKNEATVRKQKQRALEKLRKIISNEKESYE